MKLEANKLESPAMIGYRAGMKSPCVIGRKLGSLYGVPADTHCEIESLLQALDHKLGAARGTV